MSPDYIAPEVGLPLGALLWAIVLAPYVRHYLRNRKAKP